MIILVDMDGVLADFEGSFIKKYRKKHPDKRFLKLEERNTFYLKEQYASISPELGELAFQLFTAPGFFRELDPMPGGKEALQKMEELGHDVRICTSPLTQYENCVLEKYQWIEAHFGHAFTKKMFMVKDKTMVKGDILIDDRPVIHGSVTPEWTHVLYHQPYNAQVKDKMRITWENWEGIL
ncbi:MAG: 5'-3'-deoxyribonucleotidase [Bacteroidetes bacterium]|nr:5'-3'-deoxyribonucleotidase [Bacteroidota bacterium]